MVMSLKSERVLQTGLTVNDRPASRRIRDLDQELAAYMTYRAQSADNGE